MGAALRLMEICPVLMVRFLRARAAESPREDMSALYRAIRAKVEGDLRFEVCDQGGADETVHDGINLPRYSPVARSGRTLALERWPLWNRSTP